MAQRFTDEEVFGGAPAGDLQAYASATAAKYGVRPELVLATMQQESGGRPDAVSPKGARGPMQLMPATAKGLGVDADNPYQNIEGGVRYLRRQLDDFGGDERLALAAYNAGPGAVRKHGGVPPFAETQNYVTTILRGAPNADDLSGVDPGTRQALVAEDAAPEAPKARYSEADVFGGSPPRPAAAGLPPAIRARLAASRPAPLRPDDALGFLKGSFAGVDHAANWLESGIRKVPQIAAPLSDAGAAIRRVLPSGLVGFIDNPQDYYAAQASKGVRPGRLGEFAGNVAGTAWLPGGPLVSGAASGALLSDKTDVGGVLGDAALGGVVGRLTALGSDALQVGARRLLSKAPKVMDIPGLKKGYQEAYKAVDDSGFVFPKSDVGALVDDFEKVMGSRALTKSSREDAQGIIDYARKELANGDVSLSQLDKLRTDIYDEMVKKGGGTGKLGSEFRAKIDALIDGVPNADIKTARELYKRWTTADFVNRASKSADRAAEQTYGGDYGRKVKDRLAPLVDELKPTRNIRGATDDVKAAIEKIVRGSKTQRVASDLGGMLDPRRMGGKILTGAMGGLTGTAGIMTGGASLPMTLALQAAQLGAGFGLTGTASGIARRNVNQLLKLIAAGGTKRALAPVPTATSQAAEKLIVALRPLTVSSGVAAASQARARPKR